MDSISQVYISKLEIGDSNDKCSSSLEGECWNEDETHSRWLSFNELTNAKISCAAE
jgi:hypothetical protein